MRRLARAAAAAGFTLVAVAAGARAAPQIVAVVPSDGPVALVCHGADCGAEFSTICLQQSRFTPARGTPYDIHEADRDGVVVTGRGRDGREVRLDPGLLRIASARNQSAVRFSVPAEALGEFDLTRVSVTVRRVTTLIPVPVAGDPAPQTAAEIALAREALWAVGPSWAKFNAETMAVARLTNRMLNALPPRAPVADRERAALWDVATAQASGLSEAVLARARVVFDHCRETVSFAAGFNMRHCLGAMHDQFMRNLNFDYWDATRPGS